MVQQAQEVFKARFIEETEDYQNILIYSDFGAGKTTLAATALFVPEMRDVLYISLEGGEKALRQIVRWAKTRGVDPKRMLVIPVESYAQYSQIYEFLKLHVKFRDSHDIVKLRQLEAQVRGLPMEIRQDPEALKAAIPEPLQFQTVITDSLTEAQKYCMYQILGIDPATQKLDEEPDSAQWGDWGASREMIQFLVRRFRDLPVHSIFLAGESIDKDNKNVFHYKPMLPGQLSDDVRGLVDTVGYILMGTASDGSVVRRLILEAGTYLGTKEIKAKNRYGDNLKGAKWVDNATMEDLYALGRINDIDDKPNE